MTGYLVRRTGQMVLTLFLIITFTFFLVQAQPGDYASFYVLNPDLPPEVKDQIRAAFGLDKPAWQQYLIHLKNTLTGNLGVSFGNFPRPVLDVLAERVPRTLVLFLTATAVSFYIGFFLGKAIAWRRGGLFEYGATISGAMLFTAFTPAFALMMIWVFAFRLGWFPVGKFLDPLVWRGADVSANYVFGNMLLSAAAFITFALLVMLFLKRFGRRVPSVVALPILLGGALVIVVAWTLSGIGGLALDIVKHMVLPVATLTLISFAGTMLLTRNSMLETIREDYVMAARAKGLPDKQVRDRHAARNAMLPIVTSLVYSLIFAIDGSVIIESVFSWPGTGLTLLEAVRSEDLPLVMGAMLFIGTLSLLAHVIVDVLYVYLDPRIRYQ
ncbi:MAG: ABC transporter permease [Chloroflexota bacterium]|nr:ABC transporter permease [Chloroflexota bacterium]MDE2883959.1 ABC transporter permease [Chloroflexota bacterium]